MSQILLKDDIEQGESDPYEEGSLTALIAF